MVRDPDLETLNPIRTFVFTHCGLTQGLTQSFCGRKSMSAAGTGSGWIWTVSLSSTGSKEGSWRVTLKADFPGTLGWLSWLSKYLGLRS